MSDAFPDPAEPVLPPTPATMDFTALPRAALSHWRWKAWIRTLVFLCIGLVLLVVALFGPGRTDEFPLAGRIALAFALPTLSALHALVIPGKRWARTRWRVEATTIDYQSGIWWRVENTIPRSRVQHIELRQGPLQSRFELASLEIFTAGEHDNSITIPGLDAEEARRVRSLLLERVTGHVV